MGRQVRKLGFRLVLASLGVALLTIFLGGFVIFKVSEDSIKKDNLSAASELGARIASVRGNILKNEGEVAGLIAGVKVERFGSSWIMDSNGFLIAHMDPKFRHFVEEKTFIGDTVVGLQSVEVPVNRLGEKNIVHEATLLDLLDRFDGGFGTYNFLGQNRIIAFKVLKDRGWLVAVDQPTSTAFSELRKVKQIVFTTSFVVGLLILGFTWFATQIIIRPFYSEVEDMNEKLRIVNRELGESKSELEKATTSLARLYDLSIAMQYSGFLESHLPLVLGVAQERFEVDRILLMMPDGKGEFLRCRASVGNVYEPEEKIVVPISDEGGALAKSFMEKKSFFISGGEGVKEMFRVSMPYASIRALRSNAFAVFPLISKDRVIGVIGIDNKLRRRPLTKDHIQNIENFAYKLAALIDNTMHFQYLKKQAEELESRDRLTGLFNLEHFSEVSSGILEKSTSTGMAVTMALVYIMNFKEYNELNGYQRGDFVLSKLAEILKKLQVMDVTLGRCYGATMVALFRDNGEEQARFLLGQAEKEFNEFSFYGEKRLEQSQLLLKTVVRGYDAEEQPGFDDFFKSLESELFRLE